MSRTRNQIEKGNVTEGEQMVRGFRRRGITDPQITAAIVMFAAMGVARAEDERRWQREALEFMGINAERIINFVETGVDSWFPPAAEPLVEKTSTEGEWG